MEDLNGHHSPPGSQANSSHGSIESLAQQWAKKYVQNLDIDPPDEGLSEQLNLLDVVSKAGRENTAERLLQSLRFVSAQAWTKTEMLLAKEVRRHRINPKFINPWQIAEDSFSIYQRTLEIYTQQTISRRLAAVMELGQAFHPLYEQAMEIYTEQIAPSQLSTVIGPYIGTIRKRYTADDPRVIGFVSMQFHHTGQMLLDQLSPLEKRLVGTYFKVIDDHLYMPLHRAYDAAANHDYDSPALSAVQRLLPVSTEIAKRICQRVLQFYPDYQTYSGALSDPAVKISTIRDVEMFQVYLWVCALEGSIAAVRQELFPLCVMLYPTLKVKWELVRHLIDLLEQEIRNRLSPVQAAALTPYLLVLQEMFSPAVFGEAVSERRAAPAKTEDDPNFWKELFNH
jgi:hypothetical protein